MPRRTTTLGTPAAPSWSVEWFARVELEEQKLARRICGAATMGPGPCLLRSDHPSGRCRYHGGVPTVGPPSDNQNARIHGLYARRLQRCGDHCPMWNSCPFAGQDVLDLPQPQRPICAYERDEYAALVKHYFNEDVEPPVEQFDDEEESNGDGEGEFNETETRRRPSWDRTTRPECPEPFLLHQLVLLTIMQTRAAAALSETALTLTVEVDSLNYKMKSVKPAAALDAFIRIAREYRALRATIDTKKLMPKPREMGLASRLAPLMRKTKGLIEECLEEVPDEDMSKYEPEWARKEMGTVGQASIEEANSEDANIKVDDYAVANTGIDAESGHAVDRAGEIANEESGESTTGQAPPVMQSGPVTPEVPARPAAVRPPPLLWSDVLARRSRNPIRDYLFGDRGG